jgi:hypothetical protein
VTLAIWLFLLTQPAAPCERKVLEQGSGSVLVCKAGVL